MPKVLIELKNVSFNYEDDVDNPTVKGINLQIFENEFVTFLGPSGCGKTTTLRMIAGFNKPSSGLVIIDGKVFNDIPPYARPINTVFQRYALFPHLNVLGNVEVGLKARTTSELIEFFGGVEHISSLIKEDNKKVNCFTIRRKIKELIDQEAIKALEIVNLKGFEKRRIDNMSGGQMQRVAIARAIINRPKILLLDEPLAALDLKLRQNMQYELKEMQRRLGITFVFVTHDQEEAMTMSDRIVVMNDGLIQQIGSPMDIYNEPTNSFVANFIGETNNFKGIYHKNGSVSFMGATFKTIQFEGFKDKEEVDIVIRPEDMMLCHASKTGLTGKVTSCIFKGQHFEICGDFDGKEIVIHSLDSVKVGDTIHVKADFDDIHIMKAHHE